MLTPTELREAKRLLKRAKPQVKTREHLQAESARLLVSINQSLARREACLSELRRQIEEARSLSAAQQAETAVADGAEAEDERSTVALRMGPAAEAAALAYCGETVD